MSDKGKMTKAEAKVVKMVRDDYTSASNARHDASFWSKGESNPASIEDRWNEQEAVSIMLSNSSDRDDYRSDVKSPMAVGRIESVLQKLRRVNLRFAVAPEDSDDSSDKRKAKIIEELLNNVFERGQFKAKMMLGFRDALVHGTAFFQIYYYKKSREVSLIPKSADELSEDEQKDLKEGKRVYKTKEIVEYDDIMLEPVKIQEIYVDPSARELQGENYEAQFIVRRMLPSMTQFKAMFRNDPDAKNIDKVKPASQYRDDESEFFSPPRDVMGDDYVEVLHYYNKPLDKYVVIANDVVIKDMPLPYNHKQLPFIAIKTIDFPHQFYGIGIIDRLFPIQTEEEVLKNMTYDRLHITNNPIIKAKRGIYGELSKAYQNALPGSILPVTQMEDVGILDYPTTNFDVFRALEILDRDAALATQIDPVQMGIADRYVSATTSVITKEQTDSFINALIENYSGPLAKAGYQIVALMKQFYTVPKVTEKIGEVETQGRRIKMNNIEVNPDTLEIIKKRPGEYSFLEVKEDFFDINGDWDIRISPDSMEVISKGIEMQKAQANLAQLSPFLVDPTDEVKMMQHPAPLVDAVKMLEWYFETNNIPRDLLINMREDEDISIKRAEEQGARMLKGESIPGIPGELDVHKRVHVEQTNTLNREADKIEQELNEMGIPPQLAIQTSLGQKLLEIKETVRRIADHMLADDKPKMMQEQIAAQGATPQPTPQVDIPMPPGLNQATGGTPSNNTTPPVPTGRPPLINTQ